MSLRNEILRREQEERMKRESIKANKGKMLEKIAGEIYSVIERRIKTKQIYKICTKNFLTTKDTGERAVVLFCSLCFCCTSRWDEKDGEVRTYYDSDVIAVDVENLHDIDIIHKYLEHYFTNNDLLIFDNEIKLEGEKLFINSAYKLDNLKCRRDERSEDVFRTHFHLVLKI